MARANGSRRKSADSGKLPEMQCFFACDAVSQDNSPGTGTGKPSLHGIFDVIFAKNIPGVFRPFFLFARITPDVVGKRKLRIDAYTPEGAIIGEPTEMEGIFKRNKYQDIVVNYVGVPLTAYGKMRFVIKVDGKPIGWPCEITIKKPE